MDTTIVILSSLLVGGMVGITLGVAIGVFVTAYGLAVGSTEAEKKKLGIP